MFNNCDKVVTQLYVVLLFCMLFCVKLFTVFLFIMNKQRNSNFCLRYTVQIQSCKVLNWPNMKFKKDFEPRGRFQC